MIVGAARATLARVSRWRARNRVAAAAHTARTKKAGSPGSSRPTSHDKTAGAIASIPCQRSGVWSSGGRAGGMRNHNLAYHNVHAKLAAPRARQREATYRAEDERAVSAARFRPRISEPARKHLRSRRDPLRSNGLCQGGLSEHPHLRPGGEQVRGLDGVAVAPAALGCDLPSCLQQAPFLRQKRARGEPEPLFRNLERSRAERASGVACVRREAVAGKEREGFDQPRGITRAVKACTLTGRPP